MVEERQWSAPSISQAIELAQGILPREFDSWDEVPGRSKALLPTPMAYESTPTEEFVDEVREHIDPDDPDHRLWLPGWKWMTQRTLSRIAPALLPTPGANDSTGAEKETRDARAEKGTGGPSLRDLPKLLPTPTANEENPGAGGELRAGLVHGEGRRNETGIDTMGRPNEGRPSRRLPTPTARDWRDVGDLSEAPEKGLLPRVVQRVDRESAEKKLLPTPVVTDSFGSRRSTARTEDWESNPGTTLTDAIWEAQGRTTDTTGKLLPTPKAADGENSSEQGPRHYAKDEDNPTLLGAARRVTGTLKHSEDPLLPTPQAVDGSGGRLNKNEETYRTGKRPSGVAASKPLATAVYHEITKPTEESNGASTEPPSNSGNSSPDQLPDQLTIGDA